MNRILPLTIALAMMLFSIKASAQAPVVTINQVDTFALQGMPNQVVLQIQITTSNSSETLQRIAIRSLCDTVLDVDSVAIYQTINNRFSFADYPLDQVIQIAKRQVFVKDTVSFSNMTFALVNGVNYIWVVMDLSKSAVAGHNINAEILANHIVINGTSYPSSTFEPGTGIQIRQRYFSENFEDYSNGYAPLNWTQTNQSGVNTASWICNDGGYKSNPSSAKSGKYNALIYYPYYTPAITMLVSPPIDLSLSTRPELTFYHAQMQWCKSTCGPGDYDNTDTLGIYYKIGSTGAWTYITDYNLPTPAGQWIKRQIVLPNNIQQKNIYLGFRGTAQWGFGVCVDSINIYEAGVSVRQVNSIVTAGNSVTNLAPQSAENIPITRTDIRISGNTNTITLQNITVTSANKNDNDIQASGVKLWYTSDSVFVAPKLMGTAQTFSAGTVTFSSLNFTLQTGENYFWVTYNIASNATPGDTVNASIQPGGVTMSVSGTYPATAEKPASGLLIKQTIFFDDFEINRNWTLTGDFQRNTPMGLGGKLHPFPDPTYAYSGVNVIGDDLTGINTSEPGDYQPNVTYAGANMATSPLIRAQYYKNTKLSFERWLNVNIQDSAVIEFKSTTDTSWRFLWKNKTIQTDDSWETVNQIANGLFDRKNFNLRFRLGPTINIDEYSGWNIDDVFISGDSIPFDAAITRYISPLSACGLNANEHISVTVQNTGPQTLTNIPIMYSKDNGNTWVTEIIPGPLAVNDTLQYTFSTAIDLSKPAIYTMIVKVKYPLDNYPNNDSIVYQLSSYPTYTLPFTSNFDQDTTFWATGGLNSSWLHCVPSGDYIYYVPGGNMCWKTDAHSGYYNPDENSYVESPCYNFSNTDVPLVDLEYSYRADDKIDGAKMAYSLDAGKTWQDVPKDTFSFPWNWYVDTIQAYHGDEGWTGYSLLDNQQSWFRGIQALPSACGNQPLVKFRYEFKVDSSDSHLDDGFAFDFFNLYNAPHNLGVTSINNLVTPSCAGNNPENLSVTVKNFGIRKVRTTDTIFLAVMVNDQQEVIDTFPVTSVILPKGTVNLTMKKKIDISQAGNYTIKAFTILGQPGFYGYNHDTTTLQILVNPNPTTYLPDSLYTSIPDTVALTAPYNAIYGYQWNDQYGTTGTKDTFDVQNFDWQHLLVTNTQTGCFTKDSTYIKELKPDVGVSSILSPLADSCGYGTAFSPVITVTNYGTDTMRSNQKIPIGLKINSGSILYDTITLSNKFSPGDTILFTLHRKLDLSTAENVHLKIFTRLAHDQNLNNDTSLSVFEVWGAPTIGIAHILNIDQDSYTLNASGDPSIVSYLWSTGATTDTIFITSAGKYEVTVESLHGCYASDTVNVWIKIHDLGLTNITGPISACNYSNPQSINCYMKNVGTDTIYSTEPIAMSYAVNGSAFISDPVYYLPATFYPGDSVLYAFSSSVNLSQIGLYQITVAAVLTGDERPHNDTLSENISVYGNPVLNLGKDTTIVSLADTLHPGSGPLTYLWQDNSTDSLYIITRNHHENNLKYKVEATNIYGCSTTDSVRIFLKVHDVAVEKIISPVSACTMPDSSAISFQIKNMGTDTFPATNLIALSYSVNGGISVSDTIPMGKKLLPNDSTIYSFVKKSSFKNPASYNVFLTASVNGDMVPKNDTLTSVVNVYGNPTINLGPNRNDDTYSDTVRTHPNRPIATYVWQDGSKDSVYIITKSHYAPEDMYYVTVTDSHGCQASDTTFIFLIDEDLAVSKIVSPTSACTLFNNQPVTIQVKNVGNLTLTGRTVSLSYTVNNSATSTYSFNFTGDTAQSMNVVMPSSNFAAVGSYKIFAKLAFSGDVQPSNDTLTTVVYNYGNPSVSFNSVNDTIRTGNYPYTLVPQISDTSNLQYAWSDGETTYSATITKNGNYTLTITNEKGCSATAQTNVIQNVNNLSFAGLELPAGMCILPYDTTVRVMVTNSGSLSLNNVALKIEYQIGSGTPFVQNETYTGNPNDTTIYTFTQKADLSASGSYVFLFNLSAKVNADSIKNSQSYTVTVYPLPVITFNGISGDTVPALPYVLDAGAGFESYLWQNDSTSEKITIKLKGTYSVTVVDKNGCTASKSVIIDAVTAVNEVSQYDGVTLYPNPANGFVHLDINLPQPMTLIIELISSDGKNIMKMNAENSNQYNETIDLHNLAKGLYLIHIIEPNGTIVKKLLVN